MARRSFIQTLGTLGRVLGALPLLALGLPSLRAQMHRVEAPQRVTRAVGVYEWTGTLPKPAAARLIPVSIFIDSHFEDAGVYLANPVPFAIETGDVYSIEKAGKSMGTVDIEFARDVVTRHSGTDEDPLGAWYGYGRFVSPVTLTAKSNLHPSAHPSTIVASDEDADNTPHFVRRQPSGGSGSAKPSGSTTPGSTTSGSTPTGTASTTPNPAPEDDPDRPTLRHRDPAEDAKRHKSSNAEGFVTPPSDSLNNDPDRPTLRRGIPAEQAMASQLSGLPADLHQEVAVSDAVNSEAHIFSREWATSTERAQTLADLEVAARPRIANYLLTNKLTPAPPEAVAAAGGPAFANTAASSTGAAGSSASHSSTAHTAAARRKAAPPPPSFALDKEDVKGYTLSYGGMPTFIYTVETPVATGGPVYLTLVAQRLPAGELQVALSSITDASHLDRTPWLRPIDVVDADDSHRASLVFELRAQNSRQFALYRLVTAQAEQTFVTGVLE